MLSTPPINTDWTRAYAGCRVVGTLRDQLADFQVFEVFDRVFSGHGEHLYILVQKQDINTKDVQRLLARHYGVSLVDVSYAGLKDKRSIAQQWFSIRLPKTAQRPTDKHFSVLEETKHDRKLRPGDHLGNRFQIRIRNVSKSANLAPDALQQPLPNYFGPQRFGYQGNNLHRALDWVSQSTPRIKRGVRALYMSVLRSLVFNEVLASRIRSDTWRTTLNGDVMLEHFPTGPLWGRGRLSTSSDALVIEKSVERQNKAVCDTLEWVGLKQERRALVMRASGVAIQQEDDAIELRFVLPKGSYATVALNEYFDVKEARA
ncbi:MAG: tRNA pseudouridine(13) synthase TruD [Gammaproteobacteria bacterium]|nr:tRNA pseudouridine(13) synthase TruD [Gammaproteobacteria bacterium]MYI77378.1 tRNA pseudouridine(13) synthase TruD [Gammaproteobacteria bacterium]